MTMRSLVKGANVCIQVYFQRATAKWVSVAITKSTKMVTSPANNAVVFETAGATTKLYVMKGYTSNTVPLQSSQASMNVSQSSMVNGLISFTFERTLASGSVYDVAINPIVATTVQWAYADRAWPAVHTKDGSVKVLFASTTGQDTKDTTALSLSDPSASMKYSTALISAIILTTMILLGLVVTNSSGKWTTVVTLRAICAPAKQHPTFFLSWMQDIKLGEAVVVGVYVGGLVAVGATVTSAFPSAPLARLASLVAGHVALVSLMFLMLPVARGQHWERIFGTSHERIVKFHRWLGRLCVVASTVHFLVLWLVQEVDVLVTDEYGSQDAVPLFGFVAFVAFASLSLLAHSFVRRACYELFYYYHRVAAVVGLVFVMLHSPSCLYAMIFPATVYAVTALFRLGAYWNKITAIATTHGANSALVILPRTCETAKWVMEANPCAFFWVNVPSVSTLEWHPYSAIITPDGESMAFCIKASSGAKSTSDSPSRSFGDKLVQLVADSRAGTVDVVLDGPYGHPVINFDKQTYDSVVLIAGGVGITPLLSFVNRCHVHKHDSNRGLALHLHWTVRTPDDLLVASEVMFPLPPNVKATFYVTTAETNGAVQCHTGDYVAYHGGKLVLDEVLNVERYALHDKVAVMACGPPGLVQETQWYSHKCRFDFHKEVFLF
ncbi:hypothetical protein DYB26_001264 [Aphanomyces astaci]|uniref:DOMON domain-containing protein n=1 Tax=Aphanomyces astaci TaxID=112090 RepID=A0A397CL53_APHAT|nr:hypothetical protein DYB38_007348 [Aphanomyces astaci]RHY79885.1 hypothetical protein DYB26_001264 [Aphanomyces astaci]